MIDCQMGSITIGGHVFHDHKGYGLLSFSQILEFSSNVGAAKLGMRLGQQGLYEALRNFGFGSKTGIDLPGEIVGLVRDWREWSGLSIGAISFGQEVGVTSMQILNAINAIANGGYLVRPSVVDRIIDENGDLVFARTPERTRLMSPRTAEAVSEAFEGVVLRGTGKRAALEGYRAAGKTGTAQKIEGGRYSSSKYVSSFIGFAPLPKPKITILVQIDEPKGGHYGGDVSAPFFQKIAQETLMLLRVMPDQNMPLPKIAPLTADADSGDYLPNATPVQPWQSSPRDRRKNRFWMPFPCKSAENSSHCRISEEWPKEKYWIDAPIFISGFSPPALALPCINGRCRERGCPIGSVCNVTFAKGNIKEQLAATSATLANQLPGAPMSANPDVRN